jgi:pimeloyl-ACP methyl ester carboxylesterase
MNRSSLYRRARTPLSLMATVTVAAALLAVSIGPASTGKPPSVQHRKPTVVLVHGAFADSTSWNGVIKRLKRQGCPVLAVADPLRGLSGDAAYLKNLLAGIDGPVVLAGHSYGGSAVTDAAHGAGNVKTLVYVAAFIPDKGESAVEAAGRFPGTARLTAVTQRPVTGAAPAAGVFEPARKTVPSWAPVATEDLDIPPRTPLFTAERARAHTVRVRASHAVSVSHPDDVAALTEKAARTVR